MPLLKSSLDLLQVLICFTTGHRVLGLQTFPTPFKNVTIPPSSSSPHSKFLCLARDIPQRLHFTWSVTGLDSPHPQLPPCTEPEKPSQLLFPHHETMGKRHSPETKTWNDERPLLFEGSRRTFGRLPAGCSPRLRLSGADHPLSRQRPGSNVRLHQVLVQPASSSHTNNSTPQALGGKRYY